VVFFDASRLERVLALLAAATIGAGRPMLPVGQRQVLTDILVQALLGPVPTDEYVTELGWVFAFFGVFPRSGRIPEFPVAVVVAEGLSGLSDDQLAALAACPVEMAAMVYAIDDADAAGGLGQVWTDAMLRVPESFTVDPAITAASQATAARLAALSREVAGSSEGS
jgi:hypothetical protein